MAKWGQRAALAVTATLLMFFGISALSSAGANDTGGLVNGALTLEADASGDGYQIYVAVEGCPAYGTVRLLVDGHAIGDYEVGKYGRLTTTLDYSGDTVKAYCWDTGSYVIKDVDKTGQKDDDGKSGEDDGKTGGGEDDDDGDGKGDGGEDDGKTGGGGDGKDDDDGDDGKGDDDGDDGKGDDDGDDDGKGDDDGDDDGKGDDDGDDKGDGGDDKGGEDDGKDENPFKGECFTFLPPDFGGLDVVGNTFTADQGYKIVGLFWQVSPLENKWDLFTDVAFGDELQTSNLKPILKLIVCDPLGKPGYTPGELVVDAYFENGGKDIFFKVRGCSKGDEVDLFLDGVYQTTRIVTRADDLLFGLIPNPYYPDRPEVLKAVCGDAFGSVLIRPFWNVFPENGTSPKVTSDGGFKETGLVKVTDTQAGIVEVSSAAADEEIGEAVSTEAPDVGDKSGGKDLVLKDLPKTDGKISELPPLEKGVPDEGTEGLGELKVINPVKQDTRGGAASGARSTLPQAQVGLGVLSAAGLLAFVGLRRASRSMTED